MPKPPSAEAVTFMAVLSGFAGSLAHLVESAEPIGTAGAVVAMVAAFATAWRHQTDRTE